VGVDLLSVSLVQRHESAKEVLASRGIVCAAWDTVSWGSSSSWCAHTTFIVREVISDGADGQFLLKEVDHVQEQDDTSLDEPLRVADTVEEGKRFLHTIHRFILKKKLIVLRKSYKKENSGDVFKTVYPLLSFRSLTTNIYYSVG
jgi:hypothetical protein